MKTLNAVEAIQRMWETVIKNQMLVEELACLELVYLYFRVFALKQYINSLFFEFLISFTLCTAAMLVLHLQTLVILNLSTYLDFIEILLISA